MPKKTSLSTEELRELIDNFIDANFCISEIDRLMKPVNEKLPFQKAAEVLYAVLERDCHELVEQLDCFTPHPACQFSLLRDVFAMRFYADIESKAKAMFSHAEEVVAQKASHSAVRFPAFVPPSG